MWGGSNHWLVAVCLSLSLFSPSFLRRNVLFSYIFHCLREGCRSPVWGPWQMSAPAHSRTLQGREGVSYGSSSRLHGSHLLGVSSSGFQWLAAVDQIIFPMLVQQSEMHIFRLLGGCTWGVFQKTSWYYFHPVRVGEIKLTKRQMVWESRIWVAWAKASFCNTGHGNVA